MRRVAFVIGTSRPDGNTHRLVRLMNEPFGAPVIDVAALEITPYDYEHRNAGDRFLGTLESLLRCDVIAFATPVYWYAMSAQLKTFFDRLSDLLNHRKDLGRSLKGHAGCLIATGSDAELPEGFEVPFRRTCEYFDMSYEGAFYGSFRTDLEIDGAVALAAREFAATLFGAAGGLSGG